MHSLLKFLCPSSLWLALACSIKAVDYLPVSNGPLLFLSLRSPSLSSLAPSPSVLGAFLPIRSPLWRPGSKTVRPRALYTQLLEVIFPHSTP